MATIIKSLYDGQLPTTVDNALYTATDESAIVKTIRLVNTDNVARAVNLYYEHDESSNKRRITPVDLNLPPGWSYVEDDEITLGVGDKIYGCADAADKIDCIISGVARQEV